jgi:DNA-binding CsgD family transcriptional regulator
VVESVLAAIDDQLGAAREAKALAAPILTPRELAVLELLSERHTNREIAAALYISPSTAGVHVSNVLRKLGAKRRVDATTIGHRLGLLRAAETEPTHRA